MALWEDRLVAERKMWREKETEGNQKPKMTSRRPRAKSSEKLLKFRGRTTVLSLEHHANMTGIDSSIDLCRRRGVEGVHRR